MKKIYYLGYYDIQENSKENRNIVLSATNKMDYIIGVLERLGVNVNVISASTTKNYKLYTGKVLRLSDSSSLRLFITFSSKIKMLKFCGRIITIYSMFRYLFKTLEKEDTLIVYHSLGYVRIIKYLKLIIGFNLILEVEEIYSDVNGKQKDRKKEEKLFSIADSYLFSTKLLDKKINIFHKPSVVVLGSYNIDKHNNSKLFDNKIHVVYAGTFDPRKGGVVAAASAAKFLNSNYHIHILGFGSEKEVFNIKKLIKELSKDCTCIITYDGLKAGEEYIRFIQSCSIGLSTQNPHAEFNLTSFPSKILSYMSNGLRVLTIRIPAIEDSEIGNYMYYYENQVPEEIAKRIMSIDCNDNYNGRRVVNNLDIIFKSELKKILGI